MEMVTSIGLLLLTIVTSATLEEHRVVRRFAGNEWNWSGQAADAVPQTAAPWPPAKGDAGVGGRRWSPDDAQQKEEADDDIAWNTRPQGNNKGGVGGGGEEEVGNLEVLLRGVPGTDFPDFVTVPDTAFDCAEFPPSQGYYADVEAGCQVFHICQPGNRKDSFLCPLGTIFNQRHLVCDWWFNVNCSESASLYGRNSDIYGDNAAPALTTATPTPTTTTTEKPPQMPWSAQDLDKKRPPTVAKGWPMGKQNNAPRKEVAAAAAKRGAKSDSAVNSWSRSDVQKEVTLSWTTSGAYGSPSVLSSSKTSSSWNTAADPAGRSTKPVWYGIDGQPSKDQSDHMRKRTGSLNPPTASFGSRLKSSTSSAFQPTTSSRRIHSASTTARQQNWASILPDSTARFPDRHPTHLPSRHPNSNSIPTGRFLDSPAVVSSGWRQSDSSAARFPDHSIPPRRPDSSGGFPDTSIVPTGVSGVWEQDTTRTHKGTVTKSESFVHQRAEGTWGERSQVNDQISALAASPHKVWKKLRKGGRLSLKRKASLHPNSILRRKDRF